MRNTVAEGLFREPSGRPMSLIGLGAGLLFGSQFLYYGLQSGEWMLFTIGMAIGFAIQGLAEALPNGYHRPAGALRVTALVYWVSFLLVVLLVPEPLF
jgi:hypothetical protein